MPDLHELTKLGQAVWLDYIKRSFTASGELGMLVEGGLRGVTSNPTIFEKAIAGSADYDEALGPLTGNGKPVIEVYEALALEDIQSAADVLRPIYEKTQGEDGYVSLEVNPNLAHKTQETLAEARRLFAAVGRPNVMIKIPATPEGIPAIEAAIQEGINVNITLIFSLDQYEAVAQAYISGLEKRAASGKDVSQVASVASFFISRIDTAVDRALEAASNHELQGKIAVASARVAYARFKEIFSGPRWEALAARGARAQRPLWASTSTKNPAYPDTLYVDGLIGPQTVNTMPPATLEAFRDHGQVALTLGQGVEEAQDQINSLAALGIDLKAITQQLQDEGVEAFAKSFQAMLDSIREKSARLLAPRYSITASLGEYQSAIDAALEELDKESISKRIWERDYTVWKPAPNEISNRLGWLDIARRMEADLPRIYDLAQSARGEGYTHALLLGMGGSSLAPEVFRKTFGVKEGYLDLAVLDSTDPGTVLAYADALDPAKTLFIVSTKSGGTVETLSFFKFFYNRAADRLGAREAGRRFVAITDPGSKLVDLAENYGFRDTFLNDPDIGGRYSALSYFGLLPAALIGMDLERLLQRAQAGMCACGGCNPSSESENPGLRLGAMLGELAKAGRDKLTLIASPQVMAFGDWVEQLIAESTGKQGRGILPVVGEAAFEAQTYGADRLFVYQTLDGDETHAGRVDALEAGGHPVIRLPMHDLYDLGAQFFIWEMATAVGGQRLGIQPFDQPNVESAKVLARQMVDAYQKQGKLPELTPALQSGDIGVYGDVQGRTLREALEAFLAQAEAGAYASLQAYLQPSPEADAALQNLRTRLGARGRLAVTCGYGPRFLHSTGQLHKGDGGKGLFIQLTADSEKDAPIPDQAGSDASSISFGVLKLAQALGDRQALLDAGRKVIRFHLGPNPLPGLARLVETLD